MASSPYFPRAEVPPSLWRIFASGRFTYSRLFMRFTSFHPKLNNTIPPFFAYRHVASLLSMLVSGAQFVAPHIYYGPRKRKNRRFYRVEFLLNFLHAASFVCALHVYHIIVLIYGQIGYSNLFLLIIGYIRLYEIILSASNHII